MKSNTVKNKLDKFVLRIRFLMKISLKTVFFNFKYLPFKQAIRFPFLISKKVHLLNTSGRILLQCPAQSGIIRIGFGDVGIFDYKYSRTIWEVRGTVIFKGITEFGHGSRICVGDNGKLVFGKNFKITAESTIVAYNKVVFGDNCLVSWDVLIMDTDFHTIKNEKDEIINTPKPIIIGNHVWIGCRSLVLKGVQIPDNCIIGAESLVNKVLEKEGSLYVGNPLKLNKEKTTWEE